MMTKKRLNKRSGAARHASRSSRGPDPRKDVILALIARSGNHCAFRDCSHAVVNEKNLFIAEICHIKAAAEGGERYDSTQPEEERRGIANLVILCHAHHVETNDVVEWPPERMRQMKEHHEKRFLRKHFLPDEAAIQQAKRVFESEWERARQLEHLRHELTEGIAARERRAAYLRGQLDNLYGPLSFLLEANSRCFEHSNRLIVVSLEVNPNMDPERADVSGCIGASEECRTLMTANNREALHVLRTAWGWLDHDDSDILGQYILDVYRQIIEPRNKMPLDIFALNLNNQITPARIIREELLEHLRRKLAEKRAELSGLQRAK